MQFAFANVAAGEAKPVGTGLAVADPSADLPDASSCCKRRARLSARTTRRFRVFFVALPALAEGVCGGGGSPLERCAARMRACCRPTSRCRRTFALRSFAVSASAAPVSDLAGACRTRGLGSHAGSKPRRAAPASRPGSSAARRCPALQRHPKACVLRRALPGSPPPRDVPLRFAPDPDRPCRSACGADAAAPMRLRALTTTTRSCVPPWSATNPSPKRPPERSSAGKSCAGGVLEERSRGEPPLSLQEKVSGGAKSRARRRLAWRRQQASKTPQKNDICEDYWARLRDRFADTHSFFIAFQSRRCSDQ